MRLVSHPARQPTCLEGPQPQRVGNYEYARQRHCCAREQRVQVSRGREWNRSDVVSECPDAAVASLVLCTVPDQARTLAEVRRVLRPGGQLRFYEHVLSRAHALARFQRFSDATYWPHISGGCHMARDTAAAIEQAGFKIESQKRWAYRPSPLLPPEPMILGVARSPGYPADPRTEEGGDDERPAQRGR
jgi:SAM-dependent methyltransferase